MATSETNATRDVNELKKIVLSCLQEAGEGRAISLERMAQRAGGSPQNVKEWRQLLRLIKTAVTELQDSGQLEVLRKGQPVDIRDAKGVLRVRGKPAL